MHNAHPFYQQLLAAVVLPHITLFATLVVAGEAYVAIAMLTGSATRLAGIVVVVEPVE